MTDSDDSDNIDSLFNKKAHRKKGRASFVNYSDDDDDDDSVGAWESSHRKRREMNRTRKRKAPNDSTLDITLDDDDSDDDDDVVVVDGGDANAAKGSAAQPAKQPVIEMLSSDDEDFPAQAGDRHKTIYELSRGGADNESLQKLTAGRAAVANLMQAQSHSVEFVENCVENGLSTGSPIFCQHASTQYLQLHIRPSLGENSSGRNVELPASITLNMTSDEKVENVIDGFLEQANLSKNNHTVGLKYNGRGLDPKRALSKYELKSSATLDAIVYVSTVRGAKKQTPSLGKLITIKVRHQTTEDLLQIHMKDAFQVLVEKYRTLKKLGARQKVVFEFDGERLSPSRTPQSLDMEDDDLIDVRLN